MLLTPLTHKSFMSYVVESNEVSVLCFNVCEQKGSNDEELTSPHLYIDANNKLRLQVINGSKKEITIPHVKFIDKIINAPIAIGILGILEKKDLEALSESMQGYTTQIITDSGYDYIAINPNEDIIIAPTKNKVIAFNDVSIHNEISSNGNLQININYQADGKKVEPLHFTQEIFLSKSSKIPELTPLLSIGTFKPTGFPERKGSKEIYIQESESHFKIKNQLGISIALKEKHLSPPILPTDNSETKFFISFVLSEDNTSSALSLCSINDFNSYLEMKVSKNPKDCVWKSHVSNQERIKNWWFTPPQQGKFLPDGDDRILEILIEDIVTHAKAGLTPIYINWQNVNGYKDGGTGFILQKLRPRPTVESFKRCLEPEKFILSYLSKLTFNYKIYGAKKWLLEINTKDSKSIQNTNIDIEKNPDTITIKQEEFSLLPGKYKVVLRDDDVPK